MTMRGTRKAIRLGMIGCGLISHAHGRAVATTPDDVRFIACANRTLERANDWAREYGCDNAYADYRDMVEKEELDGVVIATWPIDHREHIDSNRMVKSTTFQVVYKIKGAPEAHI